MSTSAWFVKQIFSNGTSEIVHMIPEANRVELILITAGLCSHGLTKQLITTTPLQLLQSNQILPIKMVETSILIPNKTYFKIHLT